MRFSETEKRQLIIFAALAYGITYVLGLLMWYGNSTGADLSVFPNAQMLYPAAGVMMAYLLTRKGDQKVPRIFFVTFLVITVLMILCALGSVFLPQSIQAGQMEMSVWMVLVQVVLILGSIVFWITLLVFREKRDGKPAACGGETGKSRFCVCFCSFCFTASVWGFPVLWEDRWENLSSCGLCLLPGSIWLHWS